MKDKFWIEFIGMKRKRFLVIFLFSQASARILALNEL